MSSTNNKEYWAEELEKCKSSAYYFFTNYYTVNGVKATTSLTEEEFNQRFEEMMNTPPLFTKKRG